MHDLAIIGGVIHDGLGTPGRRADIAMLGDRVVAIGDDVGAARRTIDAGGRFVAPGFVDAHSHSDAHPGTYAEPDVAPLGIEHVVLGGAVVVDHGDFTGARGGAVLRAGRRSGTR